MSEDDPTHPASPAAESETTPLATISTVLPAQHWAQIAETEERGNADADSTIDAENASSTASITSSIFEYRKIHGRTYHSDQGNAQYWGSNDESQNELLDINHQTLTLGLGGKLFLAPLGGKIHQVIDIGTGTGIWAIDFADEYPNAKVIGTDISPIQPAWVPPNLQFEIEDCTREWTFASNFADYIHLRWLVGSIRDWDGLCSEAFRVCKPGGWVESHETSPTITSDDDTVDGNSAMGQWGKIFINGSKKIGSSFTVVEDGTQKKALEKAGFINIQEFDYKNPLGEWPEDPIMRQMGQYAKHTLETDTEGSVLFMAHTLGWSRPEILVYIAHLRRELRSKNHHGYFRQKVVWGQKPDAASG